MQLFQKCFNVTLILEKTYASILLTDKWTPPYQFRQSVNNVISYFLNKYNLTQSHRPRKQDYNYPETRNIK